MLPPLIDLHAADTPLLTLRGFAIDASFLLSDTLFFAMPLLPLFAMPLFSFRHATLSPRQLFRHAILLLMPCLL